MPSKKKHIRKAQPKRSPNPLAIHRFIRTTDQAAMTAATSGASPGSINLNNSGYLTLSTSALAVTQYFSGGLAFCLSDLPSYTEFVTLFDQYRILNVQLEFVPLENMAFTAGNGGYGTVGGYLHTVQDHDDASYPTANLAGIRALEQYQTYKMSSVTSLHKVSVKPRIALAAYSGAFSSYANMPATTWLDCNSPDVQHYSVKFIYEVLNPVASVTYLSFRVRATYTVEMRELR